MPFHGCWAMVAQADRDRAAPSVRTAAKARLLAPGPEGPAVSLGRFVMAKEPFCSAGRREPDR